MMEPFERFLEKFPLGTALLGYDYSICYWNKQMEEITGLEQEEVLQHNIFDLFPQLKDHGCESLWRKALETGETTIVGNVDLLKDSKDEDRQKCCIIARRMSEEYGFGGIFLIIESVTNRPDKAESLERTYQRLYEGILSSIPSSVLMFDSQLRIISANRNFLVKSRRKPSETIGKKISEVFSSVLLTHTELIQKIREIFKKGEALEGGQVTYRAPGLSTRIYYYKLVPIKDEGGVVESVMLLMDDITDKERLIEERRLAERHLASVVESASDIVVSMDPEGKITTWNSAAERISGYQFEDVTETPLIDLYAKSQREEMNLKTLTQLANGQSIRDVQIELMTAFGEEIPISWSFSPMKDNEGHIVGIVATGRDLTESRRLQAQLIQSAKMASLGVMAGGIAHEIRNPLAVSSSCAQLLLDGYDDPQLRKTCAEKIYTGIKRASSIIENLLKFARPPEREIADVDINAAIDESLTLMKSQIGTGKVHLKREFHPSTPHVRGSKNLLQQVFLNMIMNACNAMEKGGKLSVSTVLDNDERIGITFQDTGCGIPEGNVTKIFDPFFTTMSIGQGTGLGLSISYSIVKHHNGTIEVKSKEGEGSAFTVWLPPEGVKENRVKSG